jgi:hypothetical protein
MKDKYTRVDYRDLSGYMEYNKYKNSPYYTYSNYFPNSTFGETDEEKIQREKAENRDRKIDIILE